MGKKDLDFLKITFNLLASQYPARPSPQAQAATRLALERLGVTPQGVAQFLSGQIVANPADRAKLLQVMGWVFNGFQ